MSIIKPKIFVRYWVKMQPGFKVSGYQKQNFSVGTTPNMRTGYDSDLKYEKQTVDFCTECDPIFKNSSFPPTTFDASIVQKSEELGIDEYDQEDIITKIDIFPNPGTNSVTISSNQIIRSVEMLSIFGKRIMKYSDLDSKKGNFDISSLSQGIYLIKTTTDNGNEELKKFVKK